MIDYDNESIVLRFRGLKPSDYIEFKEWITERRNDN